MPGTFIEQAELASNNVFVNKCRVAMLFRAVQVLNAGGKLAQGVQSRMLGILSSAGSDASNMAWRVAVGNATVAAAAPEVPSDGDTQFAVNTFLAMD